YTVSSPRARTMTYAKRTANLLCEVVHDLRQPLGNIEISAYLLQQLLADAPPQVREHLNTIERQVDLAVRILNEAASEWERCGTQRLEEESLDLTKSETAAVT